MEKISVYAVTKVKLSVRNVENLDCRLMLIQERYTLRQTMKASITANCVGEVKLEFSEFTWRVSATS